MVVGNATGDDLQKLGQWRMKLQQDVLRMNDLNDRVVGSRQMDQEHVENGIVRVGASVPDVVQISQISSNPREGEIANTEVLMPVDPSILNMLRISFFTRVTKCFASLCCSFTCRTDTCVEYRFILCFTHCFTFVLLSFHIMFRLFICLSM